MCVNLRPNLSRLLVRAVFVCTVALPAHAVGPVESDDAPPTPSETTTSCADGQIYDDDQGKCVAPEDATDDQAGLYRDMRELAIAGRLNDAARVLDVMKPSDKVMTYRGFIARKRGDWELAEAHYLEALALNPDNLLARSYYGMGLVERGEIAGALGQLAQIRSRGGFRTWPERALMDAITGPGSGY